MRILFPDLYTKSPSFLRVNFELSNVAKKWTTQWTRGRIGRQPSGSGGLSTLEDFGSALPSISISVLSSTALFS